MMEKFNLSDWITNDLRGDTQGIPTDAVKEFIRLIKIKIIDTPTSNAFYLQTPQKDGIFDIIDKLAGDKLI